MYFAWGRLNPHSLIHCFSGQQPHPLCYWPAASSTVLLASSLNHCVTGQQPQPLSFWPAASTTVFLASSLNHSVTMASSLNHCVSGQQPQPLCFWPAASTLTFHETFPPGNIEHSPINMACSSRKQSLSNVFFTFTAFHLWSLLFMNLLSITFYISMKPSLYGSFSL